MPPTTVSTIQLTRIMSQTKPSTRKRDTIKEHLEEQLGVVRRVLETSN